MPQPQAPFPRDLESRCPSCGVVVPPDSRFCHECGVPLVDVSDHNTPMPSGERRPITILFVDALSASGDLGRLDPEEVHDMVERLLAVIGDGVERFSGTIDRFTGHGIKALFGAPVAQENHAAQACHAALHVQQELHALARQLHESIGVQLQPRMSVHSAEAVFGSIGHGPAGSEFQTQGHTAALASRIEQVAEPGQIWLSAPSAELVSDYFELRDLGLFGLRGLATPHRLYELIRAGKHTSRFEARRARGLSTFVGREAELGRLEDAYQRAQSGGPVRIALLGEAGVGKTRLCAEFTSRCRARGVAVYEVRGIESNRWLPFAAAASFLRTQFGLTANETGAAARAKAVDRILGLDPALRDDLPALLDLLGLEDAGPGVDRSDPDAQVALIGRVILALFASDDPTLPTVFVLDDCRWLDPGTAHLASLFFQWDRSGPFLFIASDRDEIESTWREHATFERLDVAPFDVATSRTLVQHHLGTASELRPLVEKIGERAGGNPFFLEELIASIADRGHEPFADDDLPATLHAVLSARIDALPESDRGLLRAASIIDREFDDETLLDLTCEAHSEVSTALERLVTSGFLTRGSADGRTVYAFRHPLLRETSYRFLLDDTRRSLHAAAAHSLIRQHPDALDEWAGLIAHHCETAGEHLAAVRWHCRAGTFLGLRVPVDAKRHWERALALTRELTYDDEVATLAMGASLRLLQLGPHLGADPKEAGAWFAAGRHHATRLKDDRTLALLLEVYGTLRSLYGTADEGAAHTQEAMQIASRTSDGTLRLVLRSRLALSLFRAGDLHAAAKLVDAPGAPSADAEATVDLLGFDAALHLRVMRVNVLTEMSALDGLRDDLDAIVAEAERKEERSLLAWAWTSFAPLARAGGVEADVAARAAHRAIALSSSGGNRMTRTPPLLALGIALTEDGRATEARDVLQRALGSIRTGGPTALLEAGILIALSRAVLRSGDPLRAERLAHEALALATARGARLYELDARLALAGALLAGRNRGRSGLVTRELDAARALLAQTGARRAAGELAQYRARLEPRASGPTGGL